MHNVHLHTAETTPKFNASLEYDSQSTQASRMDAAIACFARGRERKRRNFPLLCWRHIIWVARLTFALFYLGEYHNKHSLWDHLPEPRSNDSLFGGSLFKVRLLGRIETL